jgi:hypothetical protein
MLYTKDSNDTPPVTKYYTASREIETNRIHQQASHVVLYIITKGPVSPALRRQKLLA